MYPKGWLRPEWNHEPIGRVDQSHQDPIPFEKFKRDWCGLAYRLEIEYRPEELFLDENGKLAEEMLGLLQKAPRRGEHGTQSPTQVVKPWNIDWLKHAIDTSKPGAIQKTR